MSKGNDKGTLEEVGEGALVGLVVGASSVGLATAGGVVELGADPLKTIAAADQQLRPRWVLWSKESASHLLERGVRLERVWMLDAVHRQLVGGWRAGPERVWAHAHRLALATLPIDGPVDLFTPPDAEADPEEPIRSDGYLRPDWVNGAWDVSPTRAGRWAALALDVAERQIAELATLPAPNRAVAMARSESAAELLCAELAHHGLPVDTSEAEAIIAAYVGPRPTSPEHAEEIRHERDRAVLTLLPPDATFDLRSPAQVKSLLRRIGIEVPDTRAWRLESLRETHPAVDALLTWRKAERFATTFGYGWLDEYVGADGRLRGSWTGCDGAAGRMTATAGLHNMPAELRPAVVAEPGHVFVRADLGQIEPRVLAVVSGDDALAAAAGEADLYAPVAARLGVDRATAKVAVLGAMYGQTTGLGAQALRGLTQAYPVAMAYLDAADRSGQAGEALRTYGGRVIRMSAPTADELAPRDARSRAAAQGRYGRNAMVQGAAAELFKVWAVTVRARIREASIALCLHDELLVHAPAEIGEAVAAAMVDCLDEAAHRWASGTTVRFVADVRVVARWSDAKD